MRGNLNSMLFAFDEEYFSTSYDPVIDLQTANSTYSHGYNMSAVGNLTLPLVISISYAMPEAELPGKYVQRQCLEFLKLGLQGVTVLAASGDFGPASTDAACIDHGKGSLNASIGTFSPNFPASCPWVTAVGGTQLGKGNQKWKPGARFPPETAWYHEVSQRTGSSGGGFSRIFEAPEYQSKAVTSYFKDKDQADHLANLINAGLLNPGGRGYPDVSAMADSYLMYVLGELREIHGTSASAPVIASMIARINDVRLHAGKGPVGFINPVLYHHADDFARDITTGYSSGCGVLKAYPAIPGWDAVTGVGTVDFGKLLELYLRLP